MLPTSSLADQAARLAHENVQRQLDAAALEAFRQGKDFVALPPTYSPDPFDIDAHGMFGPVVHTVSRRAGAVEPGLDWPRDYLVYRVAAWREAGCPGA